MASEGFTFTFVDASNNILFGKKAGKEGITIADSKAIEACVEQGVIQEPLASLLLEIIRLKAIIGD